MNRKSRPSFSSEVFRLSTGEYNGALVNRSGRIIWQGGVHATADEALAEVESQRTALFIRRGLRADRYAEARA